jgi:hypothetical protein
MFYNLKFMKILLKAIVFGICVTGGSVVAQTLSLTPNLISFTTPEGQKLLLESRYQQDFFPLSSYLSVSSSILLSFSFLYLSIFLFNFVYSVLLHIKISEHGFNSWKRA